MLLNHDVRSLLKYSTDYVDFLKAYAPISNELLFQDVELIKQLTSYCRNNIRTYAIKSSPCYQDRQCIIDKSHLNDKTLWYPQNNIAYLDTTTGGTTHNIRFRYRIWKDLYHIIEGINHYNLILEEYNISKPLNILYFGSNEISTSDTLITQVSTRNVLISHGAYSQALVHTVNYGQLYLTDIYAFYERIIAYCLIHNIDVISCSGQEVASLKWNLDRLKTDRKICSLISSTGCKTNISNLIELKSKGLIDNWCDHMRCWDGGASFFTCKHHTYHLLDNLAYTHSIDGKLICDDYFSLASPFVNYWNGDYATIDDEYERCKCGRAYRKFKLDRVRSTDLKILSDSTSILQSLVDHDSPADILRIATKADTVRIITRKSFSATRKNNIARLFPSLTVLFTVEGPIDG